MYQKGFELFGLTDILEVWLSDNSTASDKLAAVYSLKRHVLCFQHFRQHLSDAIASFTHADRKYFWTNIMKIMKWRGYGHDDAIVQDIDALSAKYSTYGRVCTLLQDLKKLRAKLCVFHVSKFFTMMRVASSIAESTHSAIKGGCEFKKMLRSNNFYESMLHILQLMKIYIDDTVEDLKNFAKKGWKYSPYARKFINHAWSCMAQCAATRQVSETEWRIVQNVPEYSGGKDQTAYTLPAYTQLHVVTFDSDKTHATCTCPEYTQGLRLCAAVCAVLFQQGRGAMHKDVSVLHPCWHLENHPLWCLVHDPCIAFVKAATVSAPLQPNITSVSLFPNDVMRLAKLESAFHDVARDSLKSPHFDRLLNMLQTQKQILMGQSLDHALALPPTTAVAAVHLNRGGVPDVDVVNLSRMATSYNRASKGRLATAKAKDPTAYSLHLRGAPDTLITCDCGESVMNNKRARFYHVHHNKCHLDWLKQLVHPAGDAAVDVVPASGQDRDHAACDVNAHAAVDVHSSAQDRAAADVDAAPGNAPGNDEGSDGSCKRSSSITDSMMDEIHTAAPQDSQLTPAQNAQRLGIAATSVLLGRRTGKNAKRWVTIPAQDSWQTTGEAWSSVIAKPSDFLPNCTEAHLCHFKINQMCEHCTESALCSTHEAMKCTTELDLTEKHFAAMKRSGHCMVECGGEGDCFYHSMMFLAKLFRPDLYEKWGSHAKFRADTCEKLLVRSHFTVLNMCEYTQIVHRHLKAGRNCAWG